MSEYFHIVPWYNSDEWCEVYDKIYSQTSSYNDKEEALNLLLIWKARCPSLPSGVESTLTLLQVHVQDLKKSEDESNDQILRLAYSSAIMRFVNHMLDTETAKGSSLYQAAKNLNVPDWIIDLRHDTAHSNSLPSIVLLREATLISLSWLQNHYWNKYKDYIKDYTSGQKEVDNGDENKIAVLMNFCISLSICAHSKCKIDNLAEIPDANMRDSIVNDAKELFNNHIDLSNLKTVSVGALIDLMDTQAKRLLKNKTNIPFVNEILLGEESSQLLSFELMNVLSSHEFRKNKLNKHYVQCFEVLLTFLHTNNLLLDFVLELIRMTQNEDNNHKCKLAALWTSEILVALKKSKQFMEKINKVDSDAAAGFKKRKELKLLFYHWFPNEKTNLLLNLYQPVPKELTNIHFVQPIISTYNSYLTYFIKDLLNLIEPCLPNGVIEKVCKLAKVISSPDSFPTKSSKIYTVDDLTSSKHETNMSTEQNGEDSDCVEVSSESLQTEEICDNIKQIQNSIWKLASQEHNWSTCPIGTLRWEKGNIEGMEF